MGSPFRDTGLEIGDLFVALNGVPYAKGTRSGMAPRAVGRYHESAFRKEQGVAEGDEVTLTRLRVPPDGTEQRLEVPGALREEVVFPGPSADCTSAGRYYGCTNPRTSSSPSDRKEIG